MGSQLSKSSGSLKNSSSSSISNVTHYLYHFVKLTFWGDSAKGAGAKEPGSVRGFRPLSPIVSGLRTPFPDPSTYFLPANWTLNPIPDTSDLAPHICTYSCALLLYH
jgi:hypothetical protein